MLQNINRIQKEKLKAGSGPLINIKYEIPKNKKLYPNPYKINIKIY